MNYTVVPRPYIGRRRTAIRKHWKSLRRVTEDREHCVKWKDTNNSLDKINGVANALYNGWSTGKS